MTVPEENLKKRVYNVTAMSFTPEQLADKIAQHVPELKVSYNPDSRQGTNNLSFLKKTKTFFSINSNRR